MLQLPRVQNLLLFAYKRVNNTQRSLAEDHAKLCIARPSYIEFCESHIQRTKEWALQRENNEPLRAPSQKKEETNRQMWREAERNETKEEKKRETKKLLTTLVTIR